jgi:hypothetical protein
MSLGNTLNGASLLELQGEDRCDYFRSLINKNGAEHLYADYLLSQRKIFLSALNSDERIKTLLKFIPSNVLPGKALTSISDCFAKESNLFFQNEHPFCELLNVGVMGVVKRDPVTHKNIQYFRKPQEFDWKMQNILSEDSIYLIHPSLHDSILKNRGDHYYANPDNIIGEGLIWNDSLKTFPQIYLSYAPSDKDGVEKVANRLGEQLTSKMPCSFWYDRDSIPLKHDFLHEVKSEASESDIVLVFLTRGCLDGGWFTQEWVPKYQREIAASNAQVIYCMLDDTPSSGQSDLLKDNPLIYLNGFESELDEPITNLRVTMESYFKSFWRLGV